MASREQIQSSVLATWRRLPHPLRWVGAAAVGGTLIIVGIALLILPGPGLLLIALGLVVLASEFVWAQALLHRVKHHSGRVSGALTRTLRSTSR